jgi:RNA polymerase sigma-70 factor (ECF subfamily)
MPGPRHDVAPICAGRETPAGRLPGHALRLGANTKARACQGCRYVIHGGYFCVSWANDALVEDGDRLMERVRAHEAAAFETLYDAYNRLVYGVAFRMLGSTAAAEDVTQAVFLKIWSAPDLFGSGNLAGWIVRMTRNRCLDALRSKARTGGELPEHMAAEDDLEDRAFAAIDAARVRAALAQLPQEQRALIESGFFDGVTHEELARRTGIPLGTVKTRIRSGLRRLRSVLEGTVNV